MALLVHVYLVVYEYFRPSSVYIYIQCHPSNLPQLVQPNVADYPKYHYICIYIAKNMHQCYITQANKNEFFSKGTNFISFLGYIGVTETENAIGFAELALVFNKIFRI